MKNEKDFELIHRLKRAEEFEGGGKILHAMQLYNAITFDFPDSSTAYFKLIEIYEKMDKLESSFNVISALLEMKHSDLDVKLYAGHFYFKHQKWEEAIAALDDEGLDIEPIVFFLRGHAYYQTAFFQKSADQLVNFISTEKSSAFLGDSYLHIAKCYFELKQPHVAIPYMEEAEKLMPTNPEVHFLQAVYFFSIGMFAHASEKISVALALGTDNRQVYEKAVEIFATNSEMSKVESTCTKYNNSFEPSAVILTYRAITLISKKKYNEATEYLNTALTLNPNYQKAKDVLKDLSEREENDLVKNF
jgi:tetratricopeptide (TPR) repeat protein